MALTGRFSFRRSFGGRIVLQVEEEVRTVWPFSRRTPFKKRWRDATLMDLAAPELRALIDLRYKRQFMAQYASDASQQGPAQEREETSGSNTVPEDQRLTRRGPSENAVISVEVDRGGAFGRRSRQGDAA